MKRLDAEPVQRAGAARAVRVQLPAKVAYDLGAITKVTASILDRLGCPQCHSGFDIRFEPERVFRVDEELRIAPLVDDGVMGSW